MEKEDYKTKINELSERSDQVREVLGKTPNWMIRWGTSLIFAIITLLLIGSAVISYNDIIPAQIVVTSKNPPVYLKARSSGRLTQVLVKASQKVEEGQLLAEIENTAKLNDILFLKQQISNYFNKIGTVDSLRTLFPTSLHLGELQTAYGSFLIAYQNLLLFNLLSPNEKQSRLLKKQLAQEEKFLENQKKQLALFEENLNLSRVNFERNKKLHQKGVISKSELERTYQSYLDDQQRYEAIKTNIYGTQIAMNTFNSALTQTNIDGTETENTYVQDLENARQNLIAAMTQWEQRYVIKSPIDGTITVFDIWDQYQNVEIDEVLFTVIPKETHGIIGRVTLPIRNSGKVKQGQNVIVKLDNYPFEEWGSLRGTILNISEVPKQGDEDFYTLYIEIEDLTTSSNKKIAFKQEMQGSAEIVLEELSVMERIFYELRKIFDQP